MRTIAVISPTYDTFRRWARKEMLIITRSVGGNIQECTDKEGTIYVPLYLTGREAEIQKISGMQLVDVVDLVPKRMSKWFGIKDSKTYRGLLGVAEMRIKTFS